MSTRGLSLTATDVSWGSEEAEAAARARKERRFEGTVGA